MSLCRKVDRLVIDLGNLKMNSEKNQADSVSEYHTAPQSTTSLTRQDSQPVSIVFFLFHEWRSSIFHVFLLRARFSEESRKNLHGCFLYGFWFEMISLDLGKMRLNSFFQLSLDEVMKKAYEKYKISLTSVQVMYAKSGEDWKSMRSKPQSPMHVLQPMSLSVNFNKAILQDHKLPKWVLLHEGVCFCEPQKSLRCTCLKSQEEKEFSVS